MIIKKTSGLDQMPDFNHVLYEWATLWIKSSSGRGRDVPFP